MDDLNGRVPLFKKIDRAVFESIDKFKQTPNYTGVQDFYNGLEEDQQKAFKALVLLILFILPVAFIGTLLWQNSGLRQDLELRTSIVNRANEVLGQSQGLRSVSPRLLSPNPIDGQSMMTSRVSNLLSSLGIDLSKIQVRDFSSTMISGGVMQSEADFSFTNLSTDELMNLFTNMIQREKFRFQEVSIKRNAESNFLEGQFHAIHFSTVTEATGEE